MSAIRAMEASKAVVRYVRFRVGVGTGQIARSATSAKPNENCRAEANCQSDSLP